MTHVPHRRSRSRAVLAALVLAVLVLPAAVGPVAQASTGGYQPITGRGSTWSANAIDQWTINIKESAGLTVGYTALGSSDGRNGFKNGTADFAVSEIPYGLTDGNTVDGLPGRGFAYMPIVAGGTSFMYNLTINGQRVESLRLSGENVTKIFTGVITKWNDPALQADNPGLRLPATDVVPVVRQDGSGTSAQFTAWMLNQHGALYNDFCRSVGKSPCTQTSNYPVPPGSLFQSKQGSDGVSEFVSQDQAEGSITYVEYSYARSAGFPVAKLLNRAGFYTLPTAENVAVALLSAQIETANTDPAVYLTQKLEGVYSSADARTYPLSSYSYIIVPTRLETEGAAGSTFTVNKGRTLGDFAKYFLCAGQAQADPLGYSPLPKNLVEAGLVQVAKIPGVDPGGVNLNTCNNPTFSSTGENLLALNAPQPPACDQQGPLQCGTPAEGAPLPAAAGGDGGGGGGAATDPSAGGASSGGGSSGQPGAAAADPAAQAAADAAALAGAVDPATGLLVDPAAAPAVDLDGDGVPDATTGGLVAGAAAGAAAPGAIPLALASASGWQPSYTFVLLTVLTLVAVMLVPPLLSRRLVRAAR